MRKNKDLFSIFPADAGVNLKDEDLDALSEHIPRGCGGEPKIVITFKSTSKYSPRMRG